MFRTWWHKRTERPSKQARRRRSWVPTLEPLEDRALLSCFVLADFNRDGKLEVAVINPNDDTVSVLRGRGDGTFEPPVSLPASPDPKAVATGDINGDGSPDLLVTNGEVWEYWLNQGDGTFSQRLPGGKGDGLCWIETGYFDGSGRLGVVVLDNATVRIFSQNSDGTFSQAASYGVCGRPNGLVVGDINNDGIPDIVIVTDECITILRRRGDGSFDCIDLGGPGGSSPVLGRFNSDSVPDILTADGSGTYLWRGTDDGSFESPAFVGDFEHRLMTAGDLDGNGTLDAAGADPGVGGCLAGVMAPSGLPGGSPVSVGRRTSN